MKKKFFLTIFILMLVFASTVSAWAAVPFVTVGEATSLTSKPSTYSWTQDNSLRNGEYEVWKVKSGSATVSIAYKTSVQGVITVDYYCTGLGSKSSLTLGNSALGNTVGEWKTAVVPVTAGSQKTIPFKYTKGSGDALATVAISNIRFSTEKASVSYTSNNSAYGSVTGSVSNNSQQILGTQITLTANPASGAQFYGWEDQDGTFLGIDKTLKFTLGEDTVITALMGPSSDAVAEYKSVKYAKLTHALETAAEAGTGQVVLINDTTITGKVTVPSGVKLLLPYNDNSTSVYEIGKLENSSPTYAWLNEAKYLNRTLTIPEGGTLTVNGQLLIGGTRVYPSTTSVQGHTSGAYAQIVNHGTIKVAGTMEVHGRVQGSGTVKVEPAGTVHEPFVLIDYAGGNNTGVVYQNGKQFPASQYTCPNIQNRVEVVSGGKILGMAAIFISDTAYEVEDVSLIGGPNASSPLIRMAKDAVLVRDFDKTKTLYPRINVAGVPVEKAKITVNGGGEIGTLKLSVSLFTFKSSGIYLGLPYNFDVVLENGEYNLPSDGFFRIMPGSTAELAEGATMNVAGKLLVYDGLCDRVGRAANYYPNETDLAKAGYSSAGNMIVNGTLNLVSGSSFGGIVQTEGTTGKIKIASGVTLGDSGEKFGCEAGSAKISIITFETRENNAVILNLPARVRNLDGTMKNLAANKTYEATGSDAWMLTSYQEQRTGETLQTHQKAYPAAMTGTWDEEMYDVRFYTDSTKTELFELQRYAIGSGKAGVTPAGVPTKAPDANYHHIFKQWDNTTYLNKLTKDVDVYAIYTTGEHSFKEQSDATHHWRECSVCGYVKDKNAHSMSAALDTTHHWTKCSGCSHIEGKTAHTMETMKDASGHWTKCSVSTCGYETDAVSHANVTKFDEEHHWAECQHCGYTDGVLTAHKMVEKSNGTDTWLECEGCKHSEGRKILLGDVDLDGDIDSDDLTVLARHVAGIVVLADKNSLDNADVTFDGNVNAEDLTRLAQYVAGIISSFDAA